MTGAKVLQGSVENIIYHNQENGYCVFSLKPEEEGEEELVCTGYIPHINEGENITVTGDYITHPVYGKQFNVQVYNKTIPTTEQGIEKYLASGVIKGIGAKLAKRIVEEFGADTLEIIEHYPERLVKLKGISLDKAMQISAIFHEQAYLRSAMLFLQSYGISSAYAMKIYERYKDQTVEVIKENPYALADDIFGIGFKTADQIAGKIGFEYDSAYRVKAGIRYCLSSAVGNGHVYLPKERLVGTACALLNLPEELVQNALMELFIEKSIVQENLGDTVAVYANAYHYAESYVAKKLLEITVYALDKSGKVEKEIDAVEKELGITLAKNQREAVSEAVSKGVLVITGGPGTGKTTTINAIIAMLLKEGYEVELAAPTGRAAKRMSEATGMQAKTIHRLLGVKFISENDTGGRAFEKNEDNPIEADVLIIDESSMVDILLMFNLLKAVGAGTRLILVGDVDQLPSVGPGNVLKDIIQSALIKVVRLDEIFRQAQKSAIVMNAHRINRGEYPKINEKESDFYFVKRYQAEETVRTLADLILNRLPGFGDYDSIRDMQVLTPMRKSPLGVTNLNKVLQEALNPPDRNKKEYEYRSTLFREGDKVMQVKNNYNMQWRVYDRQRRLIEEGLGVFNGDEGVVDRINTIGESITVLFDDGKQVDYDFSQLDELELSYAVTIHKSQGSEYRVVVMPVYSGPEMLMSRNLLYTAVTRARELAVLVGIPETLYRMVDNNREQQRYSTLCFRLQKLGAYFYSLEAKDSQFREQKLE